MKRGDIVTVAISGDFGKPRPAVIIQSDRFQDTGTLTVLLITSTVIEAPLLRVPIAPDAENGLLNASFIMIDKAMSVKRERIGKVTGRASADIMLTVTRNLAVFLGMG
ncbi:growth inhibitor PemK [Rhizobium sp. Root274]|uniref:type II toxin-antitoxin system PemK/MazF family toxin n=1 Tax=unclassified Rhizobium TaxID=2613769 RepID=UPI0007134511|nr:MULTISPECIES: type II toxin-antitoxin system PemK/MazF family toxin [unclassified Rhizobium]KQW31161.1 growth inhibitor PemK [Rhizobium sp. Root1240]KRD32707.1 growth inhibitor PemK [Rhizobium sp. Root274]